MKQFLHRIRAHGFSRERIAALLAAIAALLLILRLTDMMLCRPNTYAERIGNAWKEAGEQNS